MNQIDDFSVSIICSFLRPTELCRMRTINRWYRAKTDAYLSLKYQTICLESYTCPKCGGWFQSEDLTNDTYFYDLLYGHRDDIERDRLRLVSNTIGQDSQRASLLCEECEIEEDDNPRIGIFVEQSFRYQGSRRYTLVACHQGLYPWAFLYQNKDNQDNDKNKKWNQYYCILPLSYYNTNGGYSEYSEYSNDSHDDYDDDDEYEDM